MLVLGEIFTESSSKIGSISRLVARRISASQQQPSIAPVISWVWGVWGRN